MSVTGDAPVPEHRSVGLVVVSQHPYQCMEGRTLSRSWCVETQGAHRGFMSSSLPVSSPSRPAVFLVQTGVCSRPQRSERFHYPTPLWCSVGPMLVCGFHRKHGVILGEVSPVGAGWLSGRSWSTTEIQLGVGSIGQRDWWSSRSNPLLGQCSRQVIGPEARLTGAVL